MTASDFDKAASGKRLRMVYPEIGETVDTFITEIKGTMRTWSGPPW